MADEPKYPVKTVTKAIEIINYLAQDTGNRGIGVSELSRVLGMGKSTVHRLLDTLSFYGYVEQDGETNQYRLGWELYKIGQVVPQQNQLLNLNPVMISEMDEEEIWGLFGGRETLIPYTPNTITSLPQLMREEARVRESGYAVDAEEYCIGLYCIAMPIRDYTGQIVAAVSVSTPSGLMDEDRKKLILEALSKCSRDISRSLGYQEK